MDDVKRILVVSRPTEYARKAVHYGISLAKNYGAKLFVIHVIEDPFGIEGWNLSIPSRRSLQEEYKTMQQNIKKELDQIIALEKAQGMHIQELIKEGNQVDEIINFVKNEKMDLMIILAHEEGRLEHLLFGRDNDKLIRMMPCSVLLVKHKLF
jgi:universal stress protein A